MHRQNWFINATFYEIYPQSFLDSNGDGVGDLKGIISKLDYIKDLGFNAIWLNPIFDSPFFDAGYDVRDYYKVAPRYGTNEDLYLLFKEVHKRNMHIILDLVPGHTSIDSHWFKMSSKQERNEYSNRYIWTDSIWKSPKDFPCVRGFYERNGSVVTNFFSIQPAINYGFLKVEEPDYEMSIDDERILPNLKAMQDVIEFYLKKGADGFRVDMAGWLVKRDDEEFSGTIKIWNKILKPIKEKYPDAFFVSEWSSPFCALKTPFDSDFLLQDDFRPLHIYMCRGEDPFFKVSSKKSAKPYFDYLLSVINYAFKHEKYVSIISGNHDTIRISETLKGEELKLFYAMMFSLPGIPFLYYGDEIEMKYFKDLPSVEGGYHRTGSRTPMQWSSEINSGFSKNPKTYIKVNDEFKKNNVDLQRKDQNSLLNFLKEFLKFRKEYKAFDNDAGLVYLNKEDEDVPLRYLRYKDNENIGIFINPRDYEVPLNLYEPYKIIYKYKNKKFTGIGKMEPQSIVIAKFS